MSTKLLPFANLLNARDLGGYATRDGGETRWKAFVRTDDPSRLTEAGVQAVLDYGVQTVIDLRWAAELKKYPSPFGQKEIGLNYHHISLLSSSEEAWMTHRPVAKEQWNCVVLETAQRELRAVLGAIANAPEGGVLFHCMGGKDRTGVVASLLLALAEAHPDEIASDYCQSTDNLREFELAGQPEDKHAEILERVRCPPEQIHNMLVYLESEHGGVKGYFREIGLSDEDVKQIEARLR